MFQRVTKAALCYRILQILSITGHQSDFVCVSDGVFRGCFFAVQFASGVYGFDDGERVVGSANEILLASCSADDKSKSA